MTGGPDPCSWVDRAQSVPDPSSKTAGAPNSRRRTDIRSILEDTLSEERVERRLAAILAADVAGYSRLMGADEEGTLAALKSHRSELIDPLIAQHRGRIFKTTGAF
jgi:class 3 adenylate cyclase